MVGKLGGSGGIYAGMYCHFFRRDEKGHEKREEQSHGMIKDKGVMSSSSLFCSSLFSASSGSISKGLMNCPFC